MEPIKNSLENPSFGANTEILFVSINSGINPENERIVMDAKSVTEQNLSGCEYIEIVKVKNFEEFVKVITNTHSDTHIPFKDKNFLAILNNYTPVNPTAMEAIAQKI